MATRTYRSGKLGVTIEIDHGKCGGGRDCVDVCPAGVFEIVKKKSTAPKVDDCQECCVCVDACPVGAIRHSSCG